NLPLREELVEAAHSVWFDAEILRTAGDRDVRFPPRLVLSSRRLLPRRRRQLDALAVALGNDRHHPNAHAPGLPLGLAVVARYRCLRHHAPEVGSSPELASVLRRFRVLRLPDLDGEAVAVALDDRLD